MEYKILRNGVNIPVLGLGTYKLYDKEAEQVVSKALELGYRHIDTASFYENEEAIGRALKKSDVPREELFITSKCWEDEQGSEEVVAALERSLERLQTDYLDLYLIHWPDLKSIETWKAMEKLYEEGKVRAIGLSNFHSQHIEAIFDEASVWPMVNQFERHPYLRQEALHQLSREKGMQVEAWSPIARGEVLDEEVILNLAEKYGKTAGQIVLRWQIQTGFIVFPKTSSVDRLKENIDVFDFELEESEIEAINDLNKDHRFGKNPDELSVLEK